MSSFLHGEKTTVSNFQPGHRIMWFLWCCQKHMWCQEHTMTCKHPWGCSKILSLKKKKATTCCTIRSKKKTKREKKTEEQNPLYTVSSFQISKLHSAELKSQLWNNSLNSLPAAPSLPFICATHSQMGRHSAASTLKNSSIVNVMHVCLNTSMSLQHQTPQRTQW